MKSEDELRVCLYLMFPTVLASLTLFWFCFLCVYFGHTHFFISSSIFGVNVRVGQQIYIFKVKSCLGSVGVAQQFPKF